MHGVWKINNVTPSHPSYPVDTYCARPSMTVDWCLHRRLAYGRGRKRTDLINGVGRVVRGYIVEFQHPMYFFPSLVQPP
jgi:hypothetical protein